MTEPDHAAEIAAALRALRYDWRALARLRDTFGVEWSVQVQRVFTDLDTATLATVLAASFPPDDPRAAPSWWLDRSPAVTSAQIMLERAMTLAVNGPHGSEAPEENPRKPLRLATWWRRLFGHGAGTAATREPSGA